MALDALTLHAIVEELRPQLIGSRIEKVQQPSRDQILLTLRGNRKLLLNASPQAPRLQLTSISRENPAEPPMFCMLLRKHFASARIADIRQPSLERLVELELDIVDELGNGSTRTLILEALGRRANLILVDQNGRIVESIRRVEGDITAHRQVLPGLFYHHPTQAEKTMPQEATPEHFHTLLTNSVPETKVAQVFLDGYFGLSPMMARELVHQGCGDIDLRCNQVDGAVKTALFAQIVQLQDRLETGDFVPTMLSREGKPFEVAYCPVGQYGDYLTQTTYPTFADLLDAFYQTQEHADRIRQQGADLMRTVTKAIERLRKKLLLQEKEYETTLNREHLRVQGELLTANLYRMERGGSKVTVDNYYDDCKPITIDLDPRKSPQDNAAGYFKRYTKAKTAQSHLEVLMTKGAEELTYLESVLQALQQAESRQDFTDIRQELQDGGYVRRNPKEKKQMRRAQTGPRVFQTSGGHRVLVGRNNRQNDQLTLKDADHRDIWLHTQKIHGSHVILSTNGGDVTQEEIVEAAKLAAYYSQAKDSANVPVDYTPVKFVKKPSGGRPGMVIYTTYQTVNVKPEEYLVKAMEVK
ncbi:NFACT RNA binding domain-containing protein [Bengtsoniella intestinalis]|uniref:Rqc2 family fibronectin-binding protein n=1 Tax=Bengtsoniella intestinalis TaxID=3073143 RepID=UPI00391F2437